MIMESVADLIKCRDPIVTKHVINGPSKHALALNWAVLDKWCGLPLHLKGDLAGKFAIPNHYSVGLLSLSWPMLQHCPGLPKPIWLVHESLLLWCNPWTSKIREVVLPIGIPLWVSGQCMKNCPGEKHSMRSPRWLQTLSWMSSTHDSDLDLLNEVMWNWSICIGTSLTRQQLGPVSSLWSHESADWWSKYVLNMLKSLGGVWTLLVHFIRHYWELDLQMILFAQ